MIERLRKALADAEVIIVGAGSGLSTSAGYTYTGERFTKYFADFEEKYGFTDMYSGGFYPYSSPEEFWAYWSRYIFINRYTDIPKPVYSDLLRLVYGKNYFVITTNVDHCFQRAGFDKARLFYTQGDYGLFQCSLPCHKKTYDNEQTIRAMFSQQKDMRVPSELIPHCPVCGRPMTMNLRSDDSFVEDEGWHKAARRFIDFLDACDERRTLFLDLGTGMNTPSIIKFPFWKMTRYNPQAVYACINLGEAYVPERAGISDRSICIDDDIGNVVEKLL
ncbi:MAG: Sir2 silent information regulator family NAD-dependent deacetylase [Synergistaceae bacterium]|nr:Sir2 silent information regulator family NAD-dependent deacetylase [Synergistaceae bacterium]